MKYYTQCGDGPASNAISFEAKSIAQTITFPSIPTKTYVDSAFALPAFTSSGLPVQYILLVGPGSIAGNIYTITGTGKVTISAIQLGDNVYDTAAPVVQTFTVNKATQTIDFTAIREQLFGAPPITLNATASSSLPVTYKLVAGLATLSGNQLTINGIGSIAVRASQNGDTNYMPAVAVNRTFCVRVGELTTIFGPQYVCPGQTATYRINNITGLTYNWRLSNGTNFTSNRDSVNITWTTPGNYTLIVSATGPCGAPTANDSLVINVISPVTPGAVSNMLPANGAVNQELPLTLSWIPAIML